MPHLDDDKTRVLEATDIVRLIGEHVTLRPKGKEHVGLCPFHDDRSPSMSVSPQKQIFKCFSCGVGGDCFTFTMKFHRMEFRESLEHLAQRAGIELTQRGRQEDTQKRSERELAAKATERAMAFYQTSLGEVGGAGARRYLEERGVSAASIEAFALGYAPDSWDALASAVQKNGWDGRGFDLAGLLSTGRNGQGRYDRLRHRLIFPICDAIGRPVAFGGRVLPGGTLDDPTTDAKYLNSPEGPLFHKGRTLYGLHLAKQAIGREKTAVVVEGYLDVIACHQAGFSNVVATLGTALTPEHADALRRHAERVVLVFDADDAGRRAADRAVETFLTADFDVLIAELPEGEDGEKTDPADLMQQEDGPERWRAAVGGARDALQYVLDRMGADLKEAGGVTGRERVATEYVRQLAGMGFEGAGPIRRAMMVQRVASLLGMKEERVNELLKAGAKGGRRGTQRRAADESHEPRWDFAEAGDEASSASAGSVLAQRRVVGLLLRRAELFTLTLADGRTLDEALPPGDFDDPATRDLYATLYDALADGDAVTLTGFLSDLAAAGRERLVSLAVECDAQADRAITRGGMSAGAAEGDPERVALVDAVEALRSYRWRREYDAQRPHLIQRVRAGDDAAAVLALQRVQEQLAHRPAASRIARITN